MIRQNMLIWLDILTPKQIFFLGELNKRLEENGHDIFKTTRRYREVNELLKLKAIDALVVGKHGGATLEGKLTASAHRIKELSRVISRVKPDLSVAFASPEAARTAYGLAIPHYTINDSPHSVAVARLTIPLAMKLFSPQIIPRKVWMNLGAEKDQIIQYNALDPIAWLRTVIPDKRVLNDLKLDTSKPILFFRAEESLAAYLLGYVSERESVIIPIINRLRDVCKKAIQIVALPRHMGQIPAFKATFQEGIIVPKTVIDGPSLLSFSSIFIGAGGTMTAEAALLGIPTISCYPREPTIVEKYLMREKLVLRIMNPEKIVKRVIKILNDYECIKKIQMERAKALTSKMEDPLNIIIREIEKESSPKSSQKR
jgi:predicted glycosyltransferase